MFPKSRPRWLLLAFAILFAGHLRADSVTLVTGEKISGTIKNETPSEVTIEVPVSTTITDERVIRREDISKIDREQPDEIEYRQLIQIQPNAQLSYSPQTYGQILSALDTFLEKYPDSSYAPEIKKLADTFHDEKKHVDAGQVKYLGEWLSKEETARRSIQIRALEIYGVMQQQAAAGNLVGAMQTFDSLEHDYATTRSYPAAVVLAQQILIRLKQDLVVRMEEVKTDQDRLKKTIDFTAEPEKTSIITAAKAEQDRMNAAVDAAVKSGAKWVPLIPRCEASITNLQGTVDSETSRLAGIPVTSMLQSIDKVEAARTAFAASDYKTADALLNNATQLWSGNEAALYWAARLKEKMASPTPAPSASPGLSPTPLKTTPNATPRPVSVAVAPRPAPVPPPPETPYYMTVTGAISIAAGVLVVGGLIASVAQKRARKQAAPE